MAAERPRPPQRLFDGNAPAFIPAHDLCEWAKATFINDGSALENPDHQHLRDAHLGMLWCSKPNSRHMVSIVGQAERAQFQGGKWSKARQEQQFEEWFGSLPDFILTFDASYASVCDDTSFCALVEHELYHCGQDVNAFGEPKFNQRTGLPIYAIRGHDVEEFVGIVKRYGYGHGAGKTMELVQAAQQRPSVASASITGACGTCRQQV